MKAVALLLATSIWSICGSKLKTESGFDLDTHTPSNYVADDVLLTLYNTALDACPVADDISPIDTKRAEALYKTGGLKLLYIVDSLCVDGSKTTFTPWANDLFNNNPLFGGFAIIDPVPVAAETGFYYKRGMMQRAWTNHGVPVVWIAKPDAQLWMDRAAVTDIQKNQTVTVLLTADPNIWANEFSKPWVQGGVDLFGISSVMVALYGLTVIVRYHLDENAEEAKSNSRNKNKKGSRFSLMHNIVCTEIFSNCWRMVFAFGEGMNIIDRGISLFTFQISFSLPVIMLFGNSLATLNAWIQMTKMTNITPQELSSKLAKYQALVAGIIFVFEMLKGVLLSFTGSLALLVTYGSLFLYIVVMFITLGTFFRGYYLFLQKIRVGKTSKSGGGGNAIDVFITRANRLASALGFSLSIGMLMLVLYLSGGNASPVTYVLTNVIGEYWFVVASLAQILFAVPTLLKAKTTVVSANSKGQVVSPATNISGGANETNVSKLGTSSNVSMVSSFAATSTIDKSTRET